MNNHIQTPLQHIDCQKSANLHH